MHWNTLGEPDVGWVARRNWGDWSGEPAGLGGGLYGCGGRLELLLSQNYWYDISLCSWQKRKKTALEKIQPKILKENKS